MHYDNECIRPGTVRTLESCGRCLQELEREKDKVESWYCIDDSLTRGSAALCKEDTLQQLK